MADFCLLDVGADGDDFHAVELVEVIFDVEFVGVEGDDEGCVVGWGERGAEEGEGEVGPGLEREERSIWVGMVWKVGG